MENLNNWQITKTHIYQSYPMIPATSYARQKIACPEKLLPEIYVHSLDVLLNTTETILKHKKTRSSLSEVFCKKGVLRIFTKFTGKHLRQKIFFNKVAGLRPATLLKKSI